LSIGRGRIRISCPKFCRDPQQSIQWLQGGQIRSTLTQPFQNFLRRNVSYQCVLRERAASQAAEGRIETAATGVVCGRNVLYCLIRSSSSMASSSVWRWLLRRKVGETEYGNPNVRTALVLMARCAPF